MIPWVAQACSLGLNKIPMVIAQPSTYALGVDLGQVHDHSAVAILQSVDLVHDVRDPVTFERRRQQRLSSPGL